MNPAVHVPAPARRALTGAAMLAVVLVATALAVYHSHTLARLDAAGYFAFTGLGHRHEPIAVFAERLLAWFNPAPYVVLALGAVGVAMFRRRFAVAAGVIVMIPAAILTADTVKPLLAGLRPASGLPAAGVQIGSWPSGHATAAMILVLAWVLVSPARLRPYVALLGALFALSACYAVLTLGWHYPSDVFGGICVASMWALLTVAAIYCVDHRFGRELDILWRSRVAAREGRAGAAHVWEHVPSTAAVIAVASLPVLVVLMLRAGDLLAYAGHHLAFTAITGGIAACALLAPSLLCAGLNGGFARRPIRVRSVGR